MLLGVSPGAAGQQARAHLLDLRQVLRGAQGARIVARAQEPQGVEPQAERDDQGDERDTGDAQQLNARDTPYVLNDHHACSIPYAEPRQASAMRALAAASFA